jgi:hypothetical protein
MQSRIAAASAVLALVLCLAISPAGALAGPGPASFSSDNVTWVTARPQHTGSAGARLVGKYFYVTDPRGVWIYDVSDPANPVLTGQVVAPRASDIGQEDPDTNGKILLIDAIDTRTPGTATKLLVVDVTNKTAPKIVGALASTDHTWTCVLDCTYAYGRTGSIIDLRDPANPKVAGNWRVATGVPSSNAGASYTHDFTEVSPGLLMSAGHTSYYLDARANPLKPTILTKITSKFSTLGYHSALWPRAGKDNLLLMGTEIGSSNCQTAEAMLATYDASQVVAADDYVAANPTEPRPVANFTKLSEWRVSGTGNYVDGNAPTAQNYCGHWFEAHPDWSNGGLVTMAWYEWGTRFLKVDAAGAITQVGWYQPVAGRTASAYWVSKDTVYVLDYQRGLEVLRFTAPAS